MNDIPPLDKFGKEKLRFEVRIGKDKSGKLKKHIFIDKQLLDWSIDIESLAMAMKMGEEYREIVKKDIERHFVESVSDFIGRKVTTDEIIKATQTGWL